MTQTSPSLAEVEVGDLLAGKYRVERILGKGAMGMVVAAMHTELHELRAIKFMLPSALGESDGIERFLREARACARLKSKHVTTVYDVGRLDNGAPYIVMEYLEGTDLKDLLHQKKILPIPEAVGYVLQACEALHEAHELGIVHRDLKPANMYLAAGIGGAPCIKILDFGIAKVMLPGGGSEQHEMTTTGTIMGSPLYMSPEQMTSSRHADGRSDIWSLGVILFRMVTGVVPFQAETAPELFAKVLKDPPPPPRSVNPNLPPAFEAIILRCLEKEPAKRFQNISALVEALKPFSIIGADHLALQAEGEAPTHLWRPPTLSMPQGWFGAAGEKGKGAAVADSANAAAGVQAQSVDSMHDGATIPLSSSDRSSHPMGAFVQTGSNPLPPLPAGATPHSPEAGQGAMHEAGPVGQTSKTWTQGMGRAQPSSTARVFGIGLAIGGSIFLAAAGVFFALRGKAPADAETVSPSATALVTAVAEKASPTPTPEPAVAPEAAPATSAAAAEPSATAATEPAPKIPATATAPSGTATATTVATAVKATTTAKPATTTAGGTGKAPANGADLFGRDRK